MNYFKVSFVCSLFLLLHLITFGQEEVGNPLPKWNRGNLDIHFINTAKGESAFFILPDSTTLLVDAGAALNKGPWAAPAKPNDSREPGEWIARYILHMLKDFPKKKIDYATISHFHWDHMGGVSSEIPFSASGDYQLSGISEIPEFIPIMKLIDRGWPEYNWPVPLNNENQVNYKKFIHWQVENRGLKVEQIDVGSNTQFVLLNEPEKFPNFNIQNIAGNGKVWTGVGNNSTKLYPSSASQELKDKYDGTKENKLSIALKLSYGKFDYFTAGDLNLRYFDMAGVSSLWRDMETPVARVTGRVEVMKANHHGSYDANGINLLQILYPQVIVIPTLGASQPSMGVYRRMISKRTYDNPPDIFTTNVMEATEAVFNMNKLKSKQGHVVIRVNSGGDSYNIYVLDDSDERFIIKSKFGPYICN